MGSVSRSLPEDPEKTVHLLQSRSKVEAGALRAHERWLKRSGEKMGEQQPGEGAGSAKPGTSLKGTS